MLRPITDDEADNFIYQTCLHNLKRLLEEGFITIKNETTIEGTEEEKRIMVFSKKPSCGTENANNDNFVFPSDGYLVNSASIYSTPTGIIMSKFYILFSTMVIINSIAPCASIKEILKQISSSTEFTEFRIRLGLISVCVYFYY